MEQASLEYLLVSSKSKEPWSTAVYDPYTGSAVWSYKGRELDGHAVSCAAMLNDSLVMMAVDEQPLVLVTGVLTKKKFFQRSVVPGNVTCMVVNSRGTMCFGAVEEKIYTWLIGSGDLLSIVSVHFQKITKLALTADDSILVSADRDGVIMAFDVHTLVRASFQTEKPTPMYRWQAHGLPAWDLCLTLGGPGLNSRVATCSEDQTVKIHSLERGQLDLSLAFRRPITAIAIDSAEMHLYAGDETGVITLVALYELHSSKFKHSFTSSNVDISSMLLSNDDRPTFKGHSSKITCLATSMDSCVLASGSADKTVRLWFVMSRQCLRYFNCKESVTTVRFIRPPPADADTKCFAVSVLQKQQVHDLASVQYKTYIPSASYNNNTLQYADSLDDDGYDEMVNSDGFDQLRSTVTNKRIAELEKELENAKRINKELYEECVRKVLRTD